MTTGTLHFDFTESATRQSFFGQVVEVLPEDARLFVTQVMNDSTIPRSAHLHNLGEVLDAIDKTIATDSAKAEAGAVYRILAEAEAQVHGCEVSETHFHEVGEGLTCRTILGVCTGIERLAPERITATAVQTGSGKVECAHGLLDIPAPATAAILEKYHIPTVPDKLDGELCTPTSAALIAHFVQEFS